MCRVSSGRVLTCAELERSGVHLRNRHLFWQRNSVSRIFMQDSVHTIPEFQQHPGIYHPPDSPMN